MSENFKNIESYKELVRYRNNKMPEDERYEFERALERDPFLAEALDGFSEFKTSEIESDLRSISFVSGTKRKGIRPRVYLAVAATLLVLVVSSILFLNRSNSIDEPVLVESKDEVSKTPLTPLQTEPVVSEDTLVVDSSHVFLAEAVFEDEKEDIVIEVAEKRQSGAVVNKPEPKEVVETVKKKEQPVLMAATRSSESDSAKDKQVKVGVVREDTTEKKLAKTPILETESELKAEEENVVAIETVGYVAPQNAEIENKTVAVRVGVNASPAPLGGKDLFKSYIEENIKYPSSVENKRRNVVRLQFTVSAKGDPFDFTVLRAPENADFQNEAIRLVKEGPRWSPGIKDGIPQNQKVVVKVVFKP